jgi:hypothetical protein
MWTLYCNKYIRLGKSWSAVTALQFVKWCVNWNDRMYLVFGVLRSGLSGLVVSMLASSTRVRGFKPDRNRRIFSGEKFSACLLS